MPTEYLLWHLFMSAGPDSQDFELTIRISGHKHKHKPELSVVEPGYEAILGGTYTGFAYKICVEANTKDLP